MSARKLRPKAPSRQPAAADLRERRRAAAAADRELLSDDPIAWDAAELTGPFGRLCDSVTWSGLRDARFRAARTQLWDPVAGRWSVAQMDVNAAVALQAALALQLDAHRFDALEAELQGALTETWGAARSGVEFLLELVQDIREDVRRAWQP
jgi:hypothetical protein